MRWDDLLRFSGAAVIAHRLRSALTALGIAVGITAVALLTSFGEGVQRFVLAEFTQFGTHLIGVTPGKTQTFGISGAAISNVRPLTLDDSRALGRLEPIVAAVPVVQGNAQVEAGSRTRRTMVLGVGAAVPAVWQMRVAAGRFLPDDDAPRALVVLGARVRSELFRDVNPLGRRVRVGGQRYTVTGVMESKGQFLGFDLDDAVYVPAGKALELFDRESLMEIDLLYRGDRSLDRVSAAVRRTLLARHGTEDFTITTQQQMLDVLGNVLGVLTFAVAALGGISLFVGAVGIFTIMTIAVRERTAEVGLLRALGATRGTILTVFLVESLLLAALGGGAGLATAMALLALSQLVVPDLSLQVEPVFLLSAEVLAVLIGLAAGAAPARRAAALAPLEALRAE